MSNACVDACNAHIWEELFGQYKTSNKIEVPVNFYTSMIVKDENGNPIEAKFSVYKTEYVVPMGVLIEKLLQIQTMPWYKRFWLLFNKGTFELKQWTRVGEYIKSLLNNITISALAHQ